MNDMNQKLFFPAEWHNQSAIQLTWPHRQTDWEPILEKVVLCYIHLAKEIAKRERLVIITPEPKETSNMLKAHIAEDLIENIDIYKIPTDDTWARDHGFITLIDSRGENRLLDFRFNGWGQKFPSSQDNLICRRMAEMKILNGVYENHQDFVLEGGSIESDGQGTLLTTSQCLMAPNRNEPLTRPQLEEQLKRRLHVNRVLWLNHGYLAGDDTDSHIDTLARFCPDHTIAYVQCVDEKDEHFTELSLMEKELKEFRTAEGKPYRLVPLPMAVAEYDDEGNRLPATYANFLILNGAVLMPFYGHKQVDLTAQHQLQKAFPLHEIVPIDCRILIEQHGSLHCSTMQFPQSISYL